MDRKIIHMRALLLLWIVAGLSFAGCEPALKVTSDHDSRVDFTGYRTFRLYGNAASNISSLNHDRIVRCVRSETVGKGFVEDTVKPDLLVNITAIVKNAKDVSANTNYYGYGGAYRPYYWNTGMSSSTTTFNVDEYKEGSLIIDVVDGGTQKLIWQGIGNSRLDEDVKDADARICGAVKKIMESLPSQGKTMK